MDSSIAWVWLFDASEMDKVESGLDLENDNSSMSVLEVKTGLHNYVWDLGEVSISTYEAGLSNLRKLMRFVTHNVHDTKCLPDKKL